MEINIEIATLIPMFIAMWNKKTQINLKGHSIQLRNFKREETETQAG